MAEYIEREALIRRITEIHCADCNSCHGVRCRACWVDDTLEYIDSEPAADVAPVVHGRWRYFHKQNIAVCTECSFERDLDTNFGRAVNCPNCGAKMDSVDDG